MTLHNAGVSMKGRGACDLNDKDSTAAGSSALVDVVSSCSPALSGEQQGLVSTGNTLNGSLHLGVTKPT